MTAALDQATRETLRRVQAVNRLYEAIAHLGAAEVEQLVAAVRSGAWRPE